MLASLTIGRRQLKLKSQELELQLHLKTQELETQVRLKTQEFETQVQLKTRELDTQAKLKGMELDSLASKLRADWEAVRQQQLTEVLRKRIDTYPALYEIISVYGRNWEIERKPFDVDWSRAFLKALIENNAKNGAFFSNRVYDWYGRLRTFLDELSTELSSGRLADHKEVAKLYDIIRGPLQPSGHSRDPGLGSFIKDELGSYISSVISATYDAEGSSQR